MDPHERTMVVLGAGLLWFGWFGFIAGSALTAGGLAAPAFATTNTAAAGRAHLDDGELGGQPPPKHHGGAVAGLVGITPAAGFVTVPGAPVIGYGSRASGRGVSATKGHDHKGVTPSFSSAGLATHQGWIVPDGEVQE